MLHPQQIPTLSFRMLRWEVSPEKIIFVVHGVCEFRNVCRQNPWAAQLPPCASATAGKEKVWFSNHREVNK